MSNYSQWICCMTLRWALVEQDHQYLSRGRTISCVANRPRRQGSGTASFCSFTRRPLSTLHQRHSRQPLSLPSPHHKTSASFALSRKAPEPQQSPPLSPGIPKPARLPRRQSAEFLTSADIEGDNCMDDRLGRERAEPQHHQRKEIAAADRQLGGGGYEGMCGSV